MKTRKRSVRKVCDSMNWFWDYFAHSKPKKIVVRYRGFVKDWINCTTTNKTTTLFPYPNISSPSPPKSFTHPLTIKTHVTYHYAAKEVDQMTVPAPLTMYNQGALSWQTSHMPLPSVPEVQSTWLPKVETRLPSCWNTRLHGVAAEQVVGGFKPLVAWPPSLSAADL